MPLVNSEYGKLEKVLLCRPEYLSINNPINVIAEKHSKGGKDVDRERACKEHDEFVEAFRSYDVEVLMAETHPRYPYEVNTRDLGVTTPKGIIFGRYLKPVHWGEHRLAEVVLNKYNIPRFYKLDRGTFEGGDFMYIDDKTAAVGMGIRTNMLGIEALKLALYDTGLKLIPVDFDEDYLHLDMIFNVVGEKVAVICKEAVPDHLLDLLEKKNFELIEVSKEDVFLHACNILSIGNETIFSHHQASEVNEKLKVLGFNVEIIDLKEVLKSGGGPRCMSFPVDRRFN